jgi:regulator of RNase E activity RraA
MKKSQRPLPAAVLAALRRIDTPTVSTAVGKFLSRPEQFYTDRRLRQILPELGSFIGYAVTLEVTTNDVDSPALSFFAHYQHMASLRGPLVAVFKDVDSQPGRGASFGEGMSLLHRKCGGVGVIVDGTVRDIDGLRARRFPAMAWGTVPGHGRFKPTRLNIPVTVCGMRISPGDLLLADINGCVKIPLEHAAEVLRISRELLAREKKLFAKFGSATLRKIAGELNWE